MSSREPMAAAPPWLADRGDGTYRNPVLFADYSDPDAIRVGNEYWLTSSSFSHVPGLPILHSRDLVNWTLVNHALPRLVPAEHYAQPRHGAGVWAPALRHHADAFWIFYPDPDFGIYAVRADNPRRAWSEPVLVKAGRGLIDPCPFWDDDGAGYLIHGWAQSRAGVNNRLTLHRLDADGTAVTDAGRVVIDGDALPGWHTLEGPKLYKRGGFYFVFAPAGGVRDGYQAVFRARRIEGPYEKRIVLAQGATPVNGPHQGAWVDTPAGEDWFLHFQEMPVYGRVVHLQPMTWREDGWPVIGRDSVGDGTGEPVPVHEKPTKLAGPVAAPATSDEFVDGNFGPQWQWQSNPDLSWRVPGQVRNGLRLACVPRTKGEPTLWAAGNLLLQKFPAPMFAAATELDVFRVADGGEAGLVVFGRDYAWIGARRDGGVVRVVVRRCAGADRGGVEEEVASRAVEGGRIFLHVAVAASGRCRFSFGGRATGLTPLGPEFQATSSMWVGAKFGLFARAPAAAGACGHAEFAWFRVARA